MLDALDTYTIFTVFFGSPKAVLFARVLAVLAALAPCSSTPAAKARECARLHEQTAVAVTIVAHEAGEGSLARTDRAVAKLLGACLHESGCRVEHQVLGPAVSVYQIEPQAITHDDEGDVDGVLVHGGALVERAALRAADREWLLSHPVGAARRALSIADRGWRAYACGHLGCADAAAELQRYEYRVAMELMKW